MESAGRFKLNGFLFVHLLLPCVAAAASIDPAVEESLRQQQRQSRLAYLVKNYIVCTPVTAGIGSPELLTCAGAGVSDIGVILRCYVALFF